MKFDNNATFVNLTYVCNNNCISCIMEDNYQTKFPSFEHIKKQIDRILRYSNHIEFNGGEPTLHPDLFKILRYVNTKKPNVEIGLLTNARLFSNKKNVDKLKYLNLKNFKIITSIYGHNAELHNAITRTPNSFKEQIRGIDNLIRNTFVIEVRIILNKLNYVHLEKIALFTKRFNNNVSVNIINMKPSGIALNHINQTGYKLEDATSYLLKATKLLKKSGTPFKISHFPLCVIPKILWNKTNGVTAEKTEILFLKECQRCTKKKQCSGIWKNYISFQPKEQFDLSVKS